MSNSLEPVFTANAANKLISHHLLRESTSNMTRWIMQPLPFPTCFPYIKFRNSIIPSAYNLPTFLVYLGFRPIYARRMFIKQAETGSPATRLNMMEFVKAHVNSTWMGSKHKGSAINTLGGYSAMGEMGFTEEFVFADISDFFDEYQRDPEILESYFEKNVNKSLENLELVDLVQEFLYQRMLKLKSLNQAVDDYLEE